MQDHVLAQPAHARAEQHRYRQGNRHDGQGAHRLMDDHLVDDHLGEDRRREADELDEERSEQHVAPDAAVAQQLAREPAEAEARLRAVPLERLGLLVPREKRSLLEALELGERAGLRRLASRLEVQKLIAVGLEDDHRARLLAL